ncbi:MAG: hypothetical protein RSC08_02735 [Oscillospiraceae bacterium]
MEPNCAVSLVGDGCTCVLTSEDVTISGNYDRYDLHKRVKASGSVTVKLTDVLRVGLTKTYSRLMLAFPMVLGLLALGIKAIPSISYEKDVIADVWSVGFTLWSVPFQDLAWKVCAVACLLTIPLYWLSYRNDLEVNTLRGRYLLPRKGMAAADVEMLQRAVSAAKNSRT